MYDVVVKTFTFVSSSTDQFLSFNVLLPPIPGTAVLFMATQCGFFFFFLLLLFFFAYSQRSQIGCLPYFHTWYGLSVNLECRSEMCCTRLVEKTGRNNSPSKHLCTTSSGYIFATKVCVENRNKKTVISNISFTCPHVVNFGPLAAEISWQVWGTPANFNGFRVLASLLHQRCSTEVNQNWHDVWPSPGLVHYIHFLGLLSEFCQVQNSLCIQDLHSPSLAVLLHGSWAVGVSQTLRRSAEGATDICQGSHYIVHRPTF